MTEKSEPAEPLSCSIFTRCEMINGSKGPACKDSDCPHGVSLSDDLHECERCDLVQRERRTRVDFVEC